MRRVLAISPYTKGFGFVVLEDEDYLRDWGVRPVKSQNKAIYLNEINALIKSYDITTIAVLDRGQSWLDELAQAGRKLYRFTRQEVNQKYLGLQSRHEIAKFLLEDFPELIRYLPAKAKAGSSEKANLHIFDALSVGLLV